MSFFSTFATTLMTFGAITAVDATEHVQRLLILGGTVNPIGSNLYTVGIRPTTDSSSFCGGVLISPTHVLTTALCAKVEKAKFAAIGTHYLNGTRDGEVIRITSVQNHSLYDPTSGAYDFAMLTLETSSKIQPIKLPKPDGSDISVGIKSTTVGWGYTTYPTGNPVYELQRVVLTVWSNDHCRSVLAIGDTNVCAGGFGKNSCIDDTGGPLFIEHGPGDADDVLIGLASWYYPCGVPDYPSAYSRVSFALEWINGITNGKGTRQ